MVRLAHLKTGLSPGFIKEYAIIVCADNRNIILNSVYIFPAQRPIIPLRL